MLLLQAQSSVPQTAGSPGWFWSRSHVPAMQQLFVQLQNTPNSQESTGIAAKVLGEENIQI